MGIQIQNYFKPAMLPSATPLILHYIAIVTAKLTISKESGGKANYYFSAEPPLTDSTSMSNVV